MYLNIASAKAGIFEDHGVSINLWLRFRKTDELRIVTQAQVQAQVLATSAPLIWLLFSLSLRSVSTYTNGLDLSPEAMSPSPDHVNKALIQSSMRRSP